MESLNVVINQQGGIIDFSNFEDLKIKLTEHLDKFCGASFTEESKGFAKAAVADLRKLKKAVNDRKVEVKKLHMKPYEEFERKTKELLSLIDEPIELIDSQIKEFERRRIEDRKGEIQEIYNKCVGDLVEYAPLFRIYSTKWENSSTSLKKIGEEMEQVFLGIRMDIESLKLMRVEPDIVEYALSQYRSGYTAVEAMRKASEFAELTERRKKAEEETSAADKKRVETESNLAPIQETIDLDVGFDLAFETPSTKSFTYRVVTSQEKIEMLEGYMNSFGISFERIG